MSGGSMDYACYKVSEIAEIEEDLVIKNMLKDLSDYLHDEEWYRSADIGRERYIKTRKEFKKKWFDTPIDLKPYIDEEIERIKNEMYELIGVDVDRKDEG